MMVRKARRSPASTFWAYAYESVPRQGVYGTFSRNKETRHASVGPMELSVSGQRTAGVPAWAGVAAIMVGGVVLLARKKSKG